MKYIWSIGASVLRQVEYSYHPLLDHCVDPEDDHIETPRIFLLPCNLYRVFCDYSYQNSATRLRRFKLSRPISYVYNDKESWSTSVRAQLKLLFLNNRTTAHQPVNQASARPHVANTHETLLTHLITLPPSNLCASVGVICDASRRLHGISQQFQRQSDAARHVQKNAQFHNSASCFFFVSMGDNILGKLPPGVVSAPSFV